jgi:hypothetical protein
MIDNRKDDEERHSDAKAPTDELFLDRQERLGFDFAELIAKIGFRQQETETSRSQNTHGDIAQHDLSSHLAGHISQAGEFRRSGPRYQVAQNPTKHAGRASPGFHILQLKQKTKPKAPRRS